MTPNPPTHSWALFKWFLRDPKALSKHSQSLNKDQRWRIFYKCLFWLTVNIGLIAVGYTAIFALLDIPNLCSAHYPSFFLEEWNTLSSADRWRFLMRESGWGVGLGLLMGWLGGAAFGMDSEWRQGLVGALMVASGMGLFGGLWECLGFSYHIAEFDYTHTGLIAGLLLGLVGGIVGGWATRKVKLVYDGVEGVAIGAIAFAGSYGFMGGTAFAAHWSLWVGIGASFVLIPLGFFTGMLAIGTQKIGLALRKDAKVERDGKLLVASSTILLTFFVLSFCLFVVFCPIFGFYKGGYSAVLGAILGTVSLLLSFLAVSRLFFR